MPDLDTPLHLEMLRRSHQRGEPDRDGIYGLIWGDPQRDPALRHIRDKFLLPYVHPDKTAVEIGPGGGRWTRYMLSCLNLFAVDYHQELLDELAKNFRAPGLRLIRNDGTDFPGIPDRCVDFLFTFGVFVHLETSIIGAYLGQMKRILKPSGCAVIQYSDKTKLAAQQDPTFSENRPEVMRAMLVAHGYKILEEDTHTLWHSSVVRFSL